VVVDVDFSAATILREIYGILMGVDPACVLRCYRPRQGRVGQVRTHGSDRIGKDAFYETISAVVSACDKKSPGDIMRK
jgi:hypothetical protein